VVASRAFYAHNFPAPHHGSVESFVHYRVPTAKFTELAEFDGSVIAERTAGESPPAATTSRPTSWPST
jgi:hypothetical protein